MILFSLSLRSFPGKMKVILKVEKADKKKNNTIIAFLQLRRD